MHEVRFDSVIEVGDTECGFDLLDALLGRHDDPLVLFELVVLVALERSHDRRKPVVELGRVGDSTRDDQRRAGLVDEDRVDFVDDAVVVAALLDLGVFARRHVVAEVVEAEFVVGPVGDIGGVTRPLLGGGRIATRQDQADIHLHEAVDPTHQLGLVLGEVVVDRDQVNALLCQGIQVDGSGRGEGLAFTGLHLRDPAEMQRGATHHLHVEVPLAERANSRFAGGRKRFDEQVVEVGAVVDALTELTGLALEFVVGELAEVVFQRIDLGDDALERLQLFALARAKNLVENAHEGVNPTVRPPLPQRHVGTGEPRPPRWPGSTQRRPAPPRRPPERPRPRGPPAAWPRS